MNNKLRVIYIVVMYLIINYVISFLDDLHIDQIIEFVKNLIIDHYSNVQIHSIGTTE